MNRNFFIFVGATVFLLYIYASTGKGLLSAEMARNMIRSGEISMIVDVRTMKEWDLGHYDGAIHIPANRLTKARFVYIQPTSSILVYCNTGQRARAAAEKIRSFGFENVYYIKGGYWTLLKS